MWVLKTSQTGPFTWKKIDAKYFFFLEVIYLTIFRGTLPEARHGHSAVVCKQ